MNNDLGNLENLNTVAKDNIVNAVNDCFQYASNGKKSIVDALTGKGIEASTDLSFAELATLITNQYSTSQTITYNVDTDSVYTENRLKGADATKPETFTPSKSGYTFVGWRSDSQANLTVINSMIVGTNDITLYAVFKKIITLSYNAHGGSGSTTSQSDTMIYNNGNLVKPTFTIKSNNFTPPSDSSFYKWALNSASGTQYSPKATITLTSNATLYAIYIEPLVPKLTSNSGTGVTVSANSVNTSYQAAYKAFDRDDDTPWHCAYTNGTNWLLIKFTNARILTKCKIVSHFNNIGSITVLGSNDNSNWTTLVSNFTQAYTNGVNKTITKTISNTNSFKYVKLQLNNCTSDKTNGMCAGIRTFQVYGPNIN